jgi:hypothetical protein
MRSQVPSLGLPILGLLLLLAMVPVPGVSQPLPRGGSGSGPVDFSTGWYLGGVWIQSADQGPFGMRWGADTRGFGASLEIPAIRGIRPSVEVASIEVRERCGLSSSCPFLDGWVVRLGGTLGDLPRNSNARLAPYVRGDVGIASVGEETTFAPAVRVGILVRTIPRVAPRIEYGWARYPQAREVAEISVGVRVRVR